MASKQNTDQKILKLVSDNTVENEIITRASDVAFDAVIEAKRNEDHHCSRQLTVLVS